MSNTQKNNNEKNIDSHHYIDVLEPNETMYKDIDDNKINDIVNDTDIETGNLKNTEYQKHIFLDDLNDKDEIQNMDDIFIEKLNDDLEQIRKNEHMKNTYKKNNLSLNIQSSSEDSNDLNNIFYKAVDIYKNINSPVSMMSQQGSDNYPSDSDNDDSTFFRRGCDIDYYFGGNYSDPSSLSDENNQNQKPSGYNPKVHKVHYFDEIDPHNIIEEKDHIQDQSRAIFQVDDDFKLLSFRDIEKNIHQYYNTDNEVTHYNEIDILLTYLKGQKNLYFYANNITQIKLYFLTIPAVVLTVVVIIIAPFITSFSWGGGVISAINSLIVLCITLANRLKLESETTMFFFLANQYDKLHSSLEVAGNRMSFFIRLDNSNRNDNINRTKSHKEGFKLKLKDVENKLSEIKESNVTMLPDNVKKLFPVISHINIFSFFKKIDNVKKNTIIKLRNVKNEIRFIIFKWNKKGINILEEESQFSGDFVKERNRLLYLLNVKEKIKEDVFHLNNSFEIIDDIFSREIKYAESKKNIILLLFGFDKPKIEEYNYNNPIVKEYLKPIC